MTRIFPDKKQCIICGKEHEYPQLASTNAFGACDLDLRPSEMERSTMHLWVEECPFCGYISDDVSRLPNGVTETVKVKDFISTKSFQNADEKTFASDLACKFYKKYMLSREFDNKKGAFYALLYAAWACDDKNDKENAVFCRTSSIDFLEVLILNDKNNENLSLQKADILRRSGNFDAVIETYKSKKYSNELLNKIICFQIEKAKLKDDACYTVADV